MPVTLPLLREHITYSQAEQREVNILHQLGYRSQRNQFFEHVRKRRSLVELLVAHHLAWSPSICHAADWKEWMHGSFNLCVPVSVKNSKRVLMRFPLPYQDGYL